MRIEASADPEIRTDPSPEKVIEVTARVCPVSFCRMTPSSNPGAIIAGGEDEMLFGGK